MGTQLIVGEGQVAVFVKGGRALDFFTAGTYTLSTSNIPLLKSFINMPFGGKTPFTAEVYFINKTSKLDITWGTIDPIQVIDPKYMVKLRVRAFGQFGVKVDDYRVFLTELIGAMNEYEVVNYQKIIEYFRGVLVSKIKTLIAQAIIRHKISALEIAASIGDISEYSKDQVAEEFNRFGLKVVNFYIQSINFPDEDFAEINKILQDKAAFDIIGDQRYVSKRSFDVLESAAGNTGGTAGAMMGAGVGLGAGLGVGAAMGNVAANMNPVPPAARPEPDMPNTKRCPDCKLEFTDEVRFCSECGKPLVSSVMACPSCSREISSDSKFCPFCGGKAVLTRPVCPKCMTENDPDTKFCKECGTRLEVER
jgi:membrane protease subunit (stomatin/prohibitin family)